MSEVTENVECRERFQGESLAYKQNIKGPVRLEGEGVELQPPWPVIGTCTETTELYNEMQEIEGSSISLPSKTKLVLFSAAYILQRTQFNSGAKRRFRSLET